MDLAPRAMGRRRNSIACYAVEEMPEIDDRPEDEILGYDQHGTCR
jgi:hypothetical protein